jgi:cytidylate kinase
VLAELKRRDRIDSTREASPLRAAKDAVGIDSTDMTADEVVTLVEALVRAAITCLERDGAASAFRGCP